MSYPANPTLVEKIEAHYLGVGRRWAERRKLLTVVMVFEDGAIVEVIPRRVRRAHNAQAVSRVNGKAG